MVSSEALSSVMAYFPSSFTLRGSQWVGNPREQPNQVPAWRMAPCCWLKPRVLAGSYYAPLPSLQSLLTLRHPGMCLSVVAEPAGNLQCSWYSMLDFWLSPWYIPKATYTYFFFAVCLEWKPGPSEWEATVALAHTPTVPHWEF